MLRSFNSTDWEPLPCKVVLFYFFFGVEKIEEGRIVLPVLAMWEVEAERVERFLDESLVFL